MRPEMKIGLVVGFLLVVVSFIYLTYERDKGGKLPFDGNGSQQAKADGKDRKPLRDDSAPTTARPRNAGTTPPRTGSRPRSTTPRGANRTNDNTRTAANRSDLTPSPTAKQPRPLTPTNNRNRPATANPKAAQDPRRLPPVNTGTPNGAATPNTRLAGDENQMADRDRRATTPQRPGNRDALTTPQPKPTVSKPPITRDTRRPPVATPRPGTANPTRTSETTTVGVTTHTVAKGDTLSAIAQKYYDDDLLWTVIAKANPKVNPNRLKVGATLVIPAKPDKAARSTATRPPAPKRDETPTNRSSGAGRATYVVEKGDTLIKIAKNIYGDSELWREIYELNKDRLKSPDVVPVGTELRLPDRKPKRAIRG